MNKPEFPDMSVLPRIIDRLQQLENNLYNVRDTAMYAGCCRCDVITVALLEISSELRRLVEWVS